MSSFDVDVDTKKAIKKKWSEIETQLLRHLQTSALNSAILSAGQKIKWSVSVTEMEVRKGIINREDITNRCLCIRRDIRELEDIHNLYASEKPMISRFVELDQSMAVDGTIQDKIGQLRTSVVKRDVPVDIFTQSWKTGGITETSHRKYIEEFGETFYKRMTHGIEKAVSRQKKLDANTFEVSSHMTFACKRAGSFFGRAAMLSKGLGFLLSKNHSGFGVVYGVSGSGKTSLMASIAIQAREMLNNANLSLVLRFCGTSSKSSSGRLLLQSILQQIYSAYSATTVKIPTDFEELKISFAQSLELASGYQPLVILIDSLDQLSDEDQARSDLSWLPTNLPEHVYLIVSTLPDIGCCLKYLRLTGISEDCYLMVKPLTMNDADEIVSGYLKTANRTLQSSQLNYLLDLATDCSEEEPTVLRLRLLLDRIMKYSSSDTISNIPITVHGLINQFFDRLEQNHGELVVSLLFGLLGASSHGLGEEALQDMLAGDEDVLDSVLQYHQPPVRRIPQVSAYTHSIWRLCNNIHTNRL